MEVLYCNGVKLVRNEQEERFYSGIISCKSFTKGASEMGSFGKEAFLEILSFVFEIPREFA